MKSLSSIIEIPLDELEIHPEVAQFQTTVNLHKIQLTFKYFGQQQPIHFVKRGDKNQIVDGLLRFLAAKSTGANYLKGVQVEMSDNEVRDYRIRMNQKVKPSVLETCHNVEHLLNVVGSSQGKKRDLLKLDSIDISPDDIGDFCPDRYELICTLLDLDLKGSSLRKLMFVFYAEQILSLEKKTGVINLLDKGEISIHKAYKLLKGKKEKIAKSEARKLAMIEGQNTDVWYQLYNKSSMIMNEIEDNSVDMCIDSHPYYQLREYRNQDELSHGQEETVKEYVDNFVKFCQEKRKKLKPGGVLVTILGETYREGYQLVCSRVEVALADDGWEPVDCNIWEKLNGKYTPHPLRFVNAYERIIVVRKPGGQTHFEEIMRESSTDGYEIKKTSSGGYYMASPESCITNVIRSSVHNPSEFKEVDDQFQHDAPCPVEIYRKFLLAYSKPGHTILDAFVGSGSVGIGLVLGRNIIGFDVDPESIEFCQKRFEKFIEDKQNQLQLAA